MNKNLKNLFIKSLSILAVAALIVTGIQAQALADIILGPGGENPCAGGHDMQMQYIEVDPTCETGGVVSYKCSRCNYTEDRNEPGPLGHEQDSGDYHDSTCTEDGYVSYHCIRCGADMGSQVVPAKGHQRDGGTLVEQATCQHGGRIVYNCAICGAVMGEDTTPLADHISDGGTLVKKPTTTAPGEIEYKCTVCGIVLREEPVAPIAKRETPQALFDTSSCTLTNVPENCTVKINGKVVTNAASGTASLKNLFPQTGDYIITVIANGTDTRGESDPQPIHTHKPAAPSHIQTVPQPTKGGTGAIGGVDTSMEYSLADQDTWFTCVSSSQPVSAGIYIVRYKATTTSIASDSVEALVRREDARKPEKPNANFDGSSHQLRNLSAAMSYYSTNGGDTWTKANNSAVTLSGDQVNQAVSYKEIRVKNIADNVESDVQSTPVGRVAQPSGLSTKAATSGNNGEIRGTGNDMEYRRSGQNTWYSIGGDKVTGLEKGIYQVRRKATGYMIESNAVDVEIKNTDTSKEGTPSASFNGYNMHIDGVSNCRISFNGGSTWTDVIRNTTYVANESDVNTANGIIIYRVGNGSTSDSDRQYISLTKQPTPSGITATSATATVPGCIVGTDVSMQYRPDTQSNWIDVTGSTIPVAAGKYYLRRHGYGNALPSDWLTIVIKASTNVEPVNPKDVVPVDNTTSKNKDTEKKDTKPEEKKEPVEESKTEEPAIEVEKNIPASEEATASTGEIGWAAIEATFETAQDPVVIRLNEDTLVPADVFVKAAETGTPIVLAANDVAVWSILPSDVVIDEVNSLKSVNLGIIENSVNIPVDALSTVEDANSNQVVNKVFDVKHEGNFGFKAELTMKLTDVIPGEYANLYTYNPYTGKLEFIDSSVINDKNEASFKMTHASSYVVVTSKTAMSQDSVKEVAVQQVAQTADASTTVSNADTAKPEKQAKKSSPVVGILIAVIIVLIIALVAILIYQKRGPLDSARHKKKK